MLPPQAVCLRVTEKEAEGKQLCLLAQLNQFLHLDYQLELD